MSVNTPRITVNGYPIPEEAIAFELSRLVQFYSQHMPEDQVRAQLPALRQRAIDQAIGAKLLFDEAARLDIQVSDDDVARRLSALEQRSGGREPFLALIKKQNLDEAKLREQIRRGRRVDLLVEQVVSEAADPTEEDILAHFEAHRDEYNRQERILAQHILIKPADSSPAAKTAARERLAAIRQRAADGADFADLASDNSDCPSGKEGGSLGWFSRGMMVEAFDRAAFEMKTGELSEIIETPFGYHIIYKTDHEAPAPADIDDARESVRDFLRHARRGEALARHVDELRAQAEIVIDPSIGQAT
jgi:peptidyl-prolyl cis-trans isomerase C